MRHIRGPGFLSAKPLRGFAGLTILLALCAELSAHEGFRTYQLRRNPVPEFFGTGPIHDRVGAMPPASEVKYEQDTARAPEDTDAGAVPPKPASETGKCPPRNDIAVLANAAVPDGIEVARYYCAKRGIPLESIITVRTSAAEEIDWPTFRKEILKPVSEFLLKRTQILYLVPVYGIPLKIKEENTANDEEANKSENTVTKMVTTRDYCCVDAELALVRRPDHPLDGWIPSEIFMGRNAIKPGGDLVLVCRLDGPSAAIAKRLVDDALYGEKMGIVGKAYIDVRGLEQGNPYWSGDDDMRRAWDHMRSAGYDGMLDEKPELIDFPSLEAPALYWGWYAGDCKPSKDFKFVRGAVGAHLHSFAAHTIRAKDKAWVGPLLYYGIAATTGTVYEPLQSGFPTASTFWDKFLQGCDFAHAGYMSNMFLSWQAVFVGDPLYCPFKSGWKETQAQNRAGHAGLVADFEAARKRSEPKPLIKAAGALLAFGIEDENTGLAHQALDELDKQATSGLSAIRKLLSAKKTTEAIQRLRVAADTFASLPSGDEAAGLLKTTVAAEDAAAEKLWAKAVEFESRNDLARALEKYREIVATFPESTVAEQARTKEKEFLGDPEKEKLIAAQQREQAAMSIWDKVNSSLKNKREDLAKKYLREIVSKYPETEAAARAKDKLSELK